MTKRVENPYAGGRGPKPLTLAAKLARRTVRDEDTGCLLWTGHVDKDGYGKVWHEGRDIRAHRARMLSLGIVLGAQDFVLHTCDRPACTEPTHLYIGTQADNMRDRLERGRWAGGRPRKDER